MENDPLQDEMDDLTQDFARYYTAVERETCQETMYREAALHGRTPRQALLGGDKGVKDYSAHYDDRIYGGQSLPIFS
jgi:hypothetical protein